MSFSERFNLLISARREAASFLSTTSCHLQNVNDLRKTTDGSVKASSLGEACRPWACGPAVVGVADSSSLIFSSQPCKMPQSRATSLSITFDLFCQSQSRASSPSFRTTRPLRSSWTFRRKCCNLVALSVVTPVSRNAQRPRSRVWHRTDSLRASQKPLCVALRRAKAL